jgi:hypothetical protein
MQGKGKNMSILEDLVKSENDYIQARQRLLNATVDRVKLIKQNFNLENSDQCRTYLRLMEYLTTDEREDLVNDLSNNTHTALSWERQLWDLLVKSEKRYFITRKKFLDNKSIDRTNLIQKALHNPDQRGTCLQVMEHLTTDERKYLFSDLLDLSSVAHADLKLCHQVVLSYPHDWLLENIEERAEPLLINGSYEEYRCLLELYSRIDRNLAQRLASRAIQQDDLDIIEAGEDFREAINLRTQETLLEASLKNEKGNSTNKTPFFKIVGVSRQRSRTTIQRSQPNELD